MPSVLITGAFSGIGQATAVLFAERGWNVAATMLDPASAGAWAARPNMLALRLDVTNVESIRVAITETLARFGSIDAIVNNAGYALVGPFEASTAEQVLRQVTTNVIGVMNVTREIIPHFRRQGAGTIINLSSMAGRLTFPLYSVYHATKWAVEGFSESIAYELEPFGIRIKIIEPGPINTDFYGRSMDLAAKPELTAYDAFVRKAMFALQRAGTMGPGPQVVAKTIYKAATDRSKRLRYPVNSRLVLTVHRCLPTRAFMAIIRAATLKE